MSGPAPGTWSMIRWTAEAHRRTGQSTGSPERWWVLESIFFPFFWLTNVMVTKDEWNRRDDVSGMISLLDDLNAMHLRVKSLVLPGDGVLECSQALIAKKNPPVTMSVVCACKVLVLDSGGSENEQRVLRNLGVKANSHSNKPSQPLGLSLTCSAADQSRNTETGLQKGFL